MNAQEITKALGGHWHGSYGTARCPAHDDHQPSLSIRDGVDGEPVFNCFAHCDWREIKDVLRARGLLPERGPGNAPGGRCRPPPRATPRPDDSDQQQRMEFARRKWGEAIPLADSPAEVYLRQRGLVPGPDGWPPSLRYHPALKHGPTGLYLPAMLGAVAVWPGREVVGLHRTFLRVDGRDKAPVSNNKMMLGKCAGGAVRLAPAGPELVLSEGIETGLSVQQATGFPVWATLSTSGLRAVILPPEIKTVIIAADGDEPGEKAAQEAARRFIAEGRTVKIARPPQGMDFNDLLQMPNGVAVISDQRRRTKANG
ncbi:MAG: toprim domain-containing protein [Proteobacteria bacterium]|nr:toprim domain-containing protein [Pseudomonadota bacterium]